MNHSVNYSGFMDIVNSNEKSVPEVKRDSEIVYVSEVGRLGEDGSVAQSVVSGDVLTGN